MSVSSYPNELIERNDFNTYVNKTFYENKV